MNFNEVGIYNRHYITVDDAGRIIDGWSDGPHQRKDATGAVCINENGGYQFRLFQDGEENPFLYTFDGIPLYWWDGENVQQRTEEEIEGDRSAIPTPPPTMEEDLMQMTVDHELRLTMLELGV